MELNYLKDTLFDLLNDCEGMDISDIEADDAANTITLSVADGSVFEVECRKVTE